jgi:hypothetical protein
VGWWATKIRQSIVHVFGRVRPAERDALASWLTPAQLALFDRMHRADRRHGLDVVATLRAEGVTDADVLVAGLLHDCGKGDAGLAARVVHALADAFGGWLRRPFAAWPPLRADLDRLERHAELSADLAAAAGCSTRTVELVRWQDAPRDPEFGRLLKLADEAN